MRPADLRQSFKNPFGCKPPSEDRRLSFGASARPGKTDTTLTRRKKEKRPDPFLFCERIGALCFLYAAAATAYSAAMASYLAMLFLSSSIKSASA